MSRRSRRERGRPGQHGQRIIDRDAFYIKETPNKGMLITCFDDICDVNLKYDVVWKGGGYSHSVIFFHNDLHNIRNENLIKTGCIVNFPRNAQCILFKIPLQIMKEISLCITLKCDPGFFLGCMLGLVFPGVGAEGSKAYIWSSYCVNLRNFNFPGGNRP